MLSGDDSEHTNHGEACVNERHEVSKEWVEEDLKADFLSLDCHSTTRIGHIRPHAAIESAER